MDLDLCRQFLMKQKKKTKKRNLRQETTYNRDNNTKTIQNGDETPVEYFNHNSEDNGMFTNEQDQVNELRSKNAKDTMKFSYKGNNG